MRTSLTNRTVLPLILVAAVVAALIIISSASGWLVDWLWMRQLGYETIFWKLLGIKLGWFALVFIVVLLYFWLNLLLVIRNGRRTDAVLFASERGGGLVRWAGVLSFLISGGLAFIFAEIFSAQWDTYLRYHWGGSFGLSDPIFSADAGFYLFRLPFYELLQNSLVGLTAVTALAAFFAYRVLGIFTLPWRQPGGLRPPALHLSILLVLFSFALAWGYYLDRYELLLTNSGAVYGIGYTADHANRLALWVMFCASLALGALILAGLYLRRLQVVFWGISGYVLLYVIALLVVPVLIQKYIVEPNELELETPYLQHNIDFTRKAYQLDTIETRRYPALAELTLDQLAAHNDTLQNVRLWDWRPLLTTYRQTQEIRLYYSFYEVDVDRYQVEDGYHQVMLSARELAPALPEKARTWVNEHLQFTHGYGLVMNFVSQATEGGLPLYLIDNIPPVARYGLTVEQPAIYFGEKMPGYRIVATGVKEFDYPKGEENVYASYRGKGGIPLDSFWKRILFSWYLPDINILLTSYLAPESKILLWRDIAERVRKIAPFLQLDQDPYLVLSEGRLFWIQDAYTTSDRFPYSEPYTTSSGQTISYIRNSVKVVIDAYHGSVSFYTMDPADPVLRLYSNAFPGVFKDFRELPGDLRRHLRFPEDLFAAQANLYRTYHMTSPQVFYNREDLWTSAKEQYAGETVPMAPYYILMRLPGEKELGYLLMSPYTPSGKENMIAWIAARCDFPDYGKRIVYLLPKERLIYGPTQIAAMINQTPLISEQLSLWDQHGSRVVRGNLIVIPIENSFLYVEPVYLTAEENNIPQLKRVIAISGDRVVMETSLEEALRSVFGLKQGEKKTGAAPVATEGIAEARADFARVERAMQGGRWEDFGKAMEALKRLLSRPPPAQKGK